MATTTDDIDVEILPLIRTYKSGRVERLVPTTYVPPSLDPDTGVASKDAVIDAATSLSARLFLPPVDPSERARLPLLVYFHGGGFIAESAFNPIFHRLLNALSARAGAVAVSVEYRLAPEHPVPAAFDDAWRALRWAATGSDPWLAERADLARVFVAGDSAGANIAHNVVMRAGAEDCGVQIEGLILFHPYFWGTERLGCEKYRQEQRFIEAEDVDKVWRLVTAGAAGNDDPRIDPPVASLAGLGCRRVLVEVAEIDVLLDRGRAHYEKLLASGWAGEAQLVESPGLGHGFFCFDLHCPAAADLLQRFADFVGGGEQRAC